MLFWLLTQKAGEWAGWAVIAALVLACMALASLAPRLAQPGSAAWTGGDARRFLANITSDNTPWGAALLSARRMQTAVMSTIGGVTASIFALIAMANHFDLTAQLRRMTDRADGLVRQLEDQQQIFERKHLRQVEENQHQIENVRRDEREACRKMQDQIGITADQKYIIQVNELNSQIKEKDRSIQDYLKHIEERKRYEEKVIKYLDEVKKVTTACQIPIPVKEIDAPIDLPPAGGAQPANTPPAKPARR